MTAFVQQWTSACSSWTAGSSSTCRPLQLQSIATCITLRCPGLQVPLQTQQSQPGALASSNYDNMVRPATTAVTKFMGLRRPAKPLHMR